MVDDWTVLEDTEGICVALSLLKSANVVSHKVAVFYSRNNYIETGNIAICSLLHALLTNM